MAPTRYAIHEDTVVSQVTCDLGRSMKVTMANMSPGAAASIFHPELKLLKIVIQRVWMTPYQICYVCGHSNITGHTWPLVVSEGHRGQYESGGPLQVFFIQG